MPEIEEVASININLADEEVTSININLADEEVASININLADEEVTSININLADEEVASIKKRDDWIESVMNIEGTTQSLAIPRVSKMLNVDATTFEKHYEPRVVSLGPYHSGKTRLQTVQDLKPKIMKKFVANESENLKDLYDEVRTLCKQSMNEWYEKHSLSSDIDKFAQMMILDGCFILYFIECIKNGSHKDGHQNNDEIEMSWHDIVLVEQDIFLYENQLPFCVLVVLMNTRREFHIESIKYFVKNFLGYHYLQKRREIGAMRNNLNRIHLCFDTLIKKITRLSTQNSQFRSQNKIQAQPSDQKDTDPVHLLQLLHKEFVGKKKRDVKNQTGENHDIYTFRNVDELWGAGIYVRPSQRYDLSAIKYVSNYINRYLELPLMIVDDSTQTKFMNLIAYERCSEMNKELWVTSYICFLDSLIDHEKDVKILRSQDILYNCLGSDEEVSKLFNDIGYDLVPNPVVFDNVRELIQKHYDQKWWRDTVEFCHEHFRSTWSTLAFVGAIVALFLSSVQAYFSVWSLPSDCDGLCKYITKTHHL